MDVACPDKGIVDRLNTYIYYGVAKFLSTVRLSDKSPIFLVKQLLILKIIMRAPEKPLYWKCCNEFPTQQKRIRNSKIAESYKNERKSITETIYLGYLLKTSAKNKLRINKITRLVHL